MFSIDQLKGDIQDHVRLPSLFDLYRLVDPLTHEVYEYVNGDSVRLDGVMCYDIWHKGHPCRNCTSARALVEDKLIVKLEHSHSQVYLIDSIPVKINGRKMILELAKNVDDSLMVNIGDDTFNTDLMHIVSRMNTIVLTDPYTGLYNKKHFLSELPISLKRSIKEQIPYCGAIFDIDRFKTVNDTYGHLMGDEVIMFIANQIKTIADGECIKGARIGGDEFYLSFYGLGMDKADKLCRALRETLKKHQFGKDGQDFSVTISYGLVEYDLENPSDQSDFIDQIDKRMYEAKRRGSVV